MLSKAFCVVLTSLLALALGVSPGSAAAPETIVVEVYDPSAAPQLDRFLTKECGTKVYYTAAGHFFGKLYTSRGEERLAFHPSYRQTLTSKFGTVTTSDVGVDKIAFNDDGTVSVHGTGIHLKVKGGPSAIGLWRLVIDPESGELISDDYYGNFDLAAPEIVDYLCSVLNPQQA